MSTGEKQNIATYLQKTYEVSITRACKVVRFPKSMYYYKSKKDDSLLVDIVSSMAEKRPREGQNKIYQRLRLEGYLWNKKRVRRIYLKLGLNLRRKIKRRIPTRVKEPLTQTSKVNQTWSMDFMTDSLITGRRFRVFNVIDDYHRKALAIEIDFSFPSYSVVQTLDRIIEESGVPQRIRVDNGPEFTSTTLEYWCSKHGIELQFIQPGKPMQNGYVERFNRTYRQDVLDAYLFEDIEQAKLLSEEWMRDYNYDRPHESLEGKTPIQMEENSYKSKQINNYFVNSNPV